MAIGVGRVRAAPYPSVWEQLIALGREARAEGLAFEDFWDRAVRPGLPPVIWRHLPEERPFGAIVWANDSRTRADDQAAVRGTRESWQRSYELAPPLRGVAALTRLSGLLDRLAAGVASVDAEEPLGEAVASAA